MCERSHGNEAPNMNQRPGSKDNKGSIKTSLRREGRWNLKVKRASEGYQSSGCKCGFKGMQEWEQRTLLEKQTVSMPVFAQEFKSMEHSRTGRKSWPWKRSSHGRKGSSATWAYLTSWFIRDRSALPVLPRSNFIACEAETQAKPWNLQGNDATLLGSWETTH